jgi:nucleotide-binding universal stress UspA family protein
MPANVATSPIFARRLSLRRVKIDMDGKTRIMEMALPGMQAIVEAAKQKGSFMKTAAGQKSSRRGAPKKPGSLHLKSLLVPVDFSECSGNALDCAKSLAAEFGSQIGLVHVIEPSGIFSNLQLIPAVTEREALAAARIHLQNFSRKKLGPKPPAFSDVQTGRSYHEICETARKRRTNLLIIGTHGRSGLKHLLLGSTAEHVVRYAPCSVLVVRGLQQNGAAKFKPKRILVPVDFSTSSDAALQQALVLARQFRARLQLVHVVQLYYPVDEHDYLDYGLLAVDSQAIAQKQIAALAKKLAANGVSVQKTVGYGRPATEIINSAFRLHSDLIVISTHGFTGLDHILLGSTTEQVVRHAACPVLVVRRAK